MRSHDAAVGVAVYSFQNMRDLVDHHVSQQRGPQDGLGHRYQPVVHQSDLGSLEGQRECERARRDGFRAPGDHVNRDRPFTAQLIGRRPAGAPLYRDARCGQHLRGPVLRGIKCEPWDDPFGVRIDPQTAFVRAAARGPQNGQCNHCHRDLHWILPLSFIRVSGREREEPPTA